MIKNDQKRILATRVLREVSTHFWSMTPGMSVSELSRLTGLNRRSLARYLDPDSNTDLPIASLHIICKALEQTFDDVIPCCSPILSDMESKIISPLNCTCSNLKEINDNYVERLHRLSAAKYSTDMSRKLSTDINVEAITDDFVSECGLRKAFQKKNDGHYPLMSLSLAVAISEALGGLSELNP